jgi:predicted CopG family antitoxin
MAHKTITISEEAYNLLKSIKKDNESFTEVIKRICEPKKRKKDFLEWLGKINDSSDLADAIESVIAERETISLRF